MIITIDIGGTEIKTGIINEAKQLMPLKKYATNPFEPNFSMLDRLTEVLDDIVPEYADVNGVAISSAGVIDYEQGVVAFANENIPGYMGTAIRSYIEERYTLPCTVENDVNCALIGELSQSTYDDVENAIMFTIGTGVGGAVYINNDLYRGQNFSAGEVGYSIINGQPIERVASTTALVQFVKDRLPESEREVVDGKWIFSQAKAGNQLCQEGIQELIHHLATHIVNSMSLLNPDVIILGGGIMEQETFLRPLIESKIDELYHNELVKSSMRLEFATLGNKAGMIGAYEVFKKRRDNHV